MLRWLSGLATSLVGNHIYLVALSWAAVQTTTPANVGLILVCGSIPQAVLLLLGGVFVDRFGPKRIIIASDLLRTVLMIAFAWVVRDQVGPLLLAALAVAFGIVNGFFVPAISTAPRYLAGRASITQITAAKTVVARAAEFAGAPLGSWLIVVASVAAAFWVNVGLFAVSVVFLLLTRMGSPAGDPAPDPTSDPVDGRPRRVRSVRSDLVSGARVMAGHRTLARLLVVVFVMELGFSGPMMAGVPLLAQETGWGVRTVGWVLGGFGLGAAAAAGWLTWRKGVRRTGCAICAGLLAMGLSVVGLGVLPAVGLSVSASVVVAGLLGLASGLGAGFGGTLISSAVLQLAPVGQVGRVMSILSFSSLAAVPVTYAVTGLVTDRLSAAVPFFGGGVLVLAAALLAVLSPRVRRMIASDADRVSASA